jgi:non-specific serine/threonine protein kinase
MGLHGLGIIATYEGDLEAARALFEELLALVRERGGALMKARALNNLGVLSLLRGQLSEAAQFVEESLPLYQEYGAAAGGDVGQSNLGRIRELQGKLREAAVLYRASLATLVELQNMRGLPGKLESIAGLAARAGEAEIGARLLGASEAMRPSGHFRHPPAQNDYMERVSALTAALGDSRFEAARVAGRTLAADDAISQALTFLKRLTGADRGKSDKPAFAALLSRREQEVAALVAQGLSNRDIAKRLFISERTADTHVQHILNKLGFGSRTQIAAWVVQQGLTAPTSGK